MTLTTIYFGAVSMINTRKPGKKRIMVQIWGTIAKAIEREFKSLHIKRDSYLNKLLRTEIEYLAEEVIFPNLDEVRKRIQDCKLPDRKKITLELDDDLVNRIDYVLKEKNIPRDSFINRVLFFLVAKESHLKYLGIDYDSDSETSASPLADANSFLCNPFFHIRSNNEEKFYTLYCFHGQFGKNGPNLFSLNTVISEAEWNLIKSIENNEFIFE